MDFKSLTLYELDLLVSLARTRSIRELARRQQVPPSQISKAVKRLEHKAAAKLVERSVHGVVLTHEGLRILPIFNDILNRAEDLKQSVTDRARSTMIGIGSTSFLINHLLIPVLSVSEAAAQMRFRFLEISPDQFTNAGLRNAFEIAFHFGKMDWPSTWHQEKIGDVRWSLCCGKNHPLAAKKTITEREVLKHRFIVPSYWTQEGFALGNDGCPIPIEKRLRGHETSTAEAGIALVRATDQLAFLPDLLIRSYLGVGEVRRLQVRGWDDVNRQLYLAVRSDLVSQKLFQEIASAVRTSIEV